MDFPGNNTMTLNMATLTRMIEDSMNEGRLGKAKVRVTNTRAARGGYVDTLEVDFTTDPDPEKVVSLVPAQGTESTTTPATQLPHSQ